jgi:hypothetical protein
LSPTTNDFVLALSSDSSNLGAGVSWATELSFDTTYTVVISYDASTGTSELWLDPVDESSTSITHAGGSGTLIEAFALRQSDDYTGTIDIDNVVVGKSFCSVKPPPIFNFCSSGTSASGCNALISASGTSSATATSGFTLTGTGVEGGKNGVFFFGISGQQNSPWGFSGSRMCVVAPRFRTGLMFGSGTPGLCDNVISLDLNALWCSTCPRPLKNPGAGTVCDAQLWYRDPANALAPASSLSDAIEWTVCP